MPGKTPGHCAFNIMTSNKRPLPFGGQWSAVGGPSYKSIASPYAASVAPFNASDMVGCGCTERMIS